MRAAGSRLMCLSAVALLCAAMTVGAAPIAGQGDPSDVFPGGTVIDFDAGPPGAYGAPVFIGGVQFAANGTFYVGGAYIGYFNTRGVYSLYTPGGGGDATAFTVTFPGPVSGFAFLWGASDSTWLLTAFDGGGEVIDSLLLPPVSDSNAGDYFGIAHGTQSIMSFTLVNQGGPDWVFIDNLNYGDSQLLTAARLLKQRAEATLTAILPTVSKKLASRLSQAIKDIQDSLQAKLWVDDNHLTLSGDRVFAEEFDAAERLEKILTTPSLAPAVEAAIQSAINDLVAADDMLVLTAINDATGNLKPGGQKQLDNAQQYRAAAQNLANVISRSFAISLYRLGWIQAQRAMGNKTK